MSHTLPRARKSRSRHQSVASNDDGIKIYKSRIQSSTLYVHTYVCGSPYLGAKKNRAVQTKSPFSSTSTSVLCTWHLAD